MQEVKNKLNELYKYQNIDEVNLDIFEEVSNILNDNNINIEDKQEIVYLLIDVSKCLVGFEKIMNKLPFTIQSILKSYNDLKNIQILTETLESCKEYVLPTLFENDVSKYFDFLEEDNNELFIMYDNYYINRFNQYLLDYINRVDVNNEKFASGINKDIVNKIKDLNNCRLKR